MRTGMLARAQTPLMRCVVHPNCCAITSRARHASHTLRHFRSLSSASADWSCTQRGYLAEHAKDPAVTVTESGLQYRVVRSGPGGAPLPGPSSPCECHYEGKLTDGTIFDSTYKCGEPTTFAPHQVISGWREALLQMREGDHWELVVPPALGYGSLPTGYSRTRIKIPGHSVLLYKLELVKVHPPPSFLERLMEPRNVVLVAITAVGLYASYLHLRSAGPGSLLD